MTRTRTLGAILLPTTLIVAAGGWLSRLPYTVDYEVSLLPWLISRGWVPYRDFVDQHAPLFPLLLAGLGAGDPGRALHWTILGLYGLTLALAALVAARFAGWLAGVAALGLAVLWAMPFDATHLWYDGALAPVYLALLGLAPPPARGGGHSGVLRALGCGLLLALGLLIKQQAAIAVPFVVVQVWRAVPTNRRRALAGLAAGLLTPLVVAAGWLAAVGAGPAAGYWIMLYSLTSDYATVAARPVPAMEWGLLGTLYAPVLALLLAALTTPGRRAREYAGPAPGTAGGEAGGLAPPFPLLLYLGLLLAATVPAWPRYGRYHFQAAVPLLALGAAVAAAALVRLLAAERREGGAGGSGARLIRIGLGGLAGLLLGGYSVTGLAQWGETMALVSRLGPAQPPYAGVAAPLRACVDAHAPPGAPIVAVAVDPLLYRVLERAPPRPWAPEFAWILRNSDTFDRTWAGVVATRPPVALVESAWWGRTAAPDAGVRERWLRTRYHTAGQFPLATYPYTPAVTVLCLVRNDAP